MNVELEGRATSMQAELGAAMARFRRRVGLLTFLALVLRYACLWLILWGAVVLCCRLLVDSSATFFSFGWLGLPLILGLGWWQSRRRRLTDTALRSYFDRWYGAGGLLMAASEVDLELWNTSHAAPNLSFPSRAQPTLRWRLGGPSARCLVAGLFLWGCWTLPTSFANPVVESRRLHIDQRIEEVRQDIETLAEESWMEPQTAEDLEASLDRLQQTASGEDPARAFETLDPIVDMTLQAAREAARSTLAETESLTAAQAILDALEAAPQPLSEEATQAMAELADVLQGLQAEGASRLELTSELAAQLAAGSPDALAAVEAALANRQTDMQASMDKLRQAGLLDEGSLRRALEAQSALDSRALEAFLEQHQMNAAGAVCQRAGQLGAPGSGEATRGPGHAPLTMREPGAFEDPLKPEVLSASALKGLDQSEILGLRAVEPTLNDDLANPSGGALATATEGGGAAWTHRILPKHRQAVRQYLDPSTLPASPVASEGQDPASTAGPSVADDGPNG